MDTIQLIASLVSSIGFPIVCCGILMYYVKYTRDKDSEKISEIEAQHQEETNKLTEALNNNTVVIQRLCDYLAKGEDINADN